MEGLPQMFEILGVVGIAISMLAYLPQVLHLGREHCSAGVSGRAWTMWLVSSLLIGALAVHRHDPVFVLLQISSSTAAAVILFLSHRYRGMVCEYHARSIPKAWLSSRVVDDGTNASVHVGSGYDAVLRLVRQPVRMIRTEARQLQAVERRGEDVEALYIATAGVLLLIVPLVGLLIGISLAASSVAA
jgi:lipid-A-disaccharide synthase-like uncharacterized protein